MNDTRSTKLPTAIRSMLRNRAAAIRAKSKSTTNKHTALARTAAARSSAGTTATVSQPHGPQAYCMWCNQLISITLISGRDPMTLRTRQQRWQGWCPHCKVYGFSTQVKGRPD